MDTFRTTEGMTHAARLNRAETALSMLLMTAAVDDYGQLSTVADAILARWGKKAGHWAVGRKRSAIQSCLGKFVGKGAEPGKLRWERVRDLLVAADAERLISEAAYLFCEATGVRIPEESWSGEKRRPTWFDEDTTVFTSITVGGREWALRFWDQAQVDEMDPAPGTPVTRLDAHAAAELIRLRTEVAELRERTNALQDDVRDREHIAIGIALEFNKSIESNYELTEQLRIAVHAAITREADLARREQAVRDGEAAVERARKGQEEFRRSIERQAEERVLRVEGDAQSQVWASRRDRQSVIRERNALLDENLILRRSVWALRDDVLMSLKRRNPQASRETLHMLLDDVLPSGISTKDLERPSDVPASEVLQLPSIIDQQDIDETAAGLNDTS
ncbi:hypothetical protein [Saccharothrix sp. NRRL B-16314]|uniref:hypothetical protein n=1 Tax=Saccharothrix sp. NRRL B-16314 TaxID=1463825 RepID=UPI0005270303|nr:hypothetical protein [Saccharothrix sp. NRRL B-16314]